MVNIYKKLFINLIVCLFTIPQTLGHAQAVTPPQAHDERQLEAEREAALSEALSTVAPSLKAPKKEEAKSDKKNPVLEKVKELRARRKAQFKDLPASHIRKMIQAKTVLKKEAFLNSQVKNLDAILNRAIEVHIPAQVALERMSLAKFRITKAVRDLFPEAKLEGDLKKGELSGSEYNSDHWRMILRQPIFRGGVLWNTLFLEWSGLDVAKREFDKTIADLVSDVSEAYFEYERTTNVLRERTQLFEKVKEQKKISDQKNEAKLISEIEKLNTDSLYSQAQYDLETAEQESEVALLDLQKFLDLESSDAFQIDAFYELDTLNTEGLKNTIKIKGAEGSGDLNASLESLIELSYQNRSDLKVETSKLKAALYAYRVALGKQLPQADAIMEFGELAEAFNIDSDDPKHRKEFRVGMEVNWNLAGNTLKYTYDHDQRAPSVTQFQSGQGSRTRSNAFSVAILDGLDQFSSILEAKISSLEQVVELEKVEREVIREVKEAYFNFNKALIQVESTHKRMKYRERLAQLASHRLGTNEIQISEYLQAEMDLAEERALVYKALADFFSSEAKLNRAIGIRDFINVESLR